MSTGHTSMRAEFASRLHQEMQTDPAIIVLVADLGFGMFDQIRSDFRDRFFNPGACEQAVVGCAIGLAESGKKPFVYSITPFLLCRAFEWIRNYINHEIIPVRLVGSGINDDYKRDGYTHHAFDAESILRLFPNIASYFPKDNSEIAQIVSEMCENPVPSFVCLKRN